MYNMYCMTAGENSVLATCIHMLKNLGELRPLPLLPHYLCRHLTKFLAEIVSDR